MDGDAAAGPVLRVHLGQSAPMGLGELLEPPRVPDPFDDAHRAEDRGEDLVRHLGVEVRGVAEREVERCHGDLRPLHVHHPDRGTDARGAVLATPAQRVVGHRRADGAPECPLGEVDEFVVDGLGAGEPAGGVRLTAFRRDPDDLADLAVGLRDRTGLDQRDQLLGVQVEHSRPAEEFKEGLLRVHDAGGVQRVLALFGGVDGVLLVGLGLVRRGFQLGVALVQLLKDRRTGRLSWGLSGGSGPSRGPVPPWRR